MDLEAIERWEGEIQSQKKNLKDGWKHYTLGNDSPFPLYNFVSFILTRQENGNEIGLCYIFGGQGRYAGKSDLLYEINANKSLGKLTYTLIPTKNTPTPRCNMQCTPTVVKGITSKTQQSVYMFGGDVSKFMVSRILKNFSDEFFELDVSKLLSSVANPSVRYLFIILFRYLDFQEVEIWSYCTNQP